MTIISVWPQATIIVTAGFHLIGVTRTVETCTANFCEFLGSIFGAVLANYRTTYMYFV